MFFLFCENAGYKETVNTLASNLLEFLQGLNTLNHHITSKFPTIRLPHFQVSVGADESLIVCCHTTRTNIEHVLVGMIKTVAEVLHNIQVSVIKVQPDDVLPDRIQFQVRTPADVPPDVITRTLNHDVNVPNFESKLNPTTLCHLFPFHIMFDSRLKIVQAGVAVARVIKEIDNQMLSFRGHLPVYRS